MKTNTMTVLISVLMGLGVAQAQMVDLSREVYKKVGFSSQYSDAGALILNVDYTSVNALIPQLEEQFQELLGSQNLRDRNEAHITVLTPPEARTGFIPGKMGTDQVLPTKEMLNRYRGIIQDSLFEVLCVGMQQNAKGNVVFYLVLNSPDVFSIRKDIENIVSDSGRTDIPFQAVGSYYPHITIGYVGGDVHGVSKGVDTCVAGVNIY